MNFVNPLIRECFGEVIAELENGDNNGLSDRQNATTRQES